MKYLLSLIFLLVLVAPALADKPVRYDWDGSGNYWTLPFGKERVADSTVALVRDTLSYPRIYGMTAGHAYMTLDSAAGTSATDSFAVVLRHIPYYEEIDGSGSVGDTLYWQTGTADSSKVLNWTPGSTYRACEFRLYASQFYQFILLGSAGDNIYYTFYFQQVIPGKQ